MNNFKVGDEVTIHPSGAIGYIREIDMTAAYPIIVYIGKSFEGSFTLTGQRYSYPSEYYITKKQAQITHPVPMPMPIRHYWQIKQVNDNFLYLTHEIEVGAIISISLIKTIQAVENKVHIHICTEKMNYNLGPISIEEVATLLFKSKPQEQL